MAKGKLSPSLAVKDASVTLVGEWMSGLWPQAQEAAHG
jgi:simple sugar transport system ATP-binding protein